MALTDKVLAALRGAGPIRPGAVGDVAVRHDWWCPILAGREECTCNPEVTLVWRPLPPEPPGGA